MASIKDILELEKNRSSANFMELHLHKEGTFLRAYDWSAWLACRYLHDFKVNKRTFKGIDEPVVYIGFPETSIEKWMPEGAQQRVDGEKLLVVRLPDLMIMDNLEIMQKNYEEWKNLIPLAEASRGKKNNTLGTEDENSVKHNHAVSLTSVMQRVLSWPIESKSPLESVAFLADVKQQLATLI